MRNKILKLTAFLYPKLWVTFGLGFFFLGLYLVIVRSAALISQASFNELLQSPKHLSWSAVFYALAFCSAVTLLVYAIRRVIIVIYQFIYE